MAWDSSKVLFPLNSLNFNFTNDSFKNNDQGKSTEVVLPKISTRNKQTLRYVPRDVNSQKSN